MARKSFVPSELFSVNAVGMTDIVAQGFNPGKCRLLLRRVLTLGNNKKNYVEKNYNPGNKNKSL